jgi:amidase
VAWTDDPFCPVDPEVGAVLIAAVEQLERAGAQIDHDRRPGLDAAATAAEGLRLIAAATAISNSDDEHAADVAAGRTLGHREWDVLHRRRGDIRQRWAEFFTEVDVLLCPTIPVPPFAHRQSPDGPNWLHATLPEYGGRHYSSLIGWSALIGSAYLPATAAPAGRTAGGLPIGIQIVAPYLHDRTALAFARCLAEVIGGYEPPPPARG